MAAGSGIPYIKSYLNGVKIPGLLTFRAFVAKTLGVVLSILGGLACGKVTWCFLFPIWLYFPFFLPLIISFKVHCVKFFHYLSFIVII